MRTVTIRTASGGLSHSVEVGPHHLTADEPAENGGQDKGPSPHEWVLAGLGACTAMTLQVYAKRKEWPLTGVEVSVAGERGEQAFSIQRTIRLQGNLSEEQRTRLLEIASKCPVHKTLTGEVRIQSELG